MTSSPFLTLTGARSPLSGRLPSPTERTLPRLRFSLAVAGRTMPDLVLDSASTRLTRILSPRGRSLGMIQYSLQNGLVVCDQFRCELFQFLLLGGVGSFP